jgi:hypothetical protein
MSTSNPSAIFGSNLLVWLKSQDTATSNTFTPSTGATWNGQPTQSWSDQSGDGNNFSGSSNGATLLLDGSATGGVFSISVAVGSGGPQQTAGIPYNASAATIQSALTGLSNVGSGNMTVGALQTNSAGTYAQITCGGSLASSAVYYSCNSQLVACVAAIVQQYPIARAHPPGVYVPVRINSNYPIVGLKSATLSSSVNQSGFGIWTVITRSSMGDDGTADQYGPTGSGSVYLAVGNNGKLFIALDTRTGGLLVNISGLGQDVTDSHGNVPLVPNSPTVVGYWVTSGSIYARVGNNVYGPLGSSTSGSDSTLTLMCNAALTQAQFHGVMSEVVTVNAAVTLTNEASLYSWLTANNGIDTSPTVNLVVDGSSLETTIWTDPLEDWPRQISSLRGQSYFNFAHSGKHAAVYDLSRPTGAESPFNCYIAGLTNYYIAGAPYNDFVSSTVTSASQMWSGTFVQSLSCSGSITGGSFALSVFASGSYQSTGAISYTVAATVNSTGATTIQTALNGLSNLGGGSFTVTASGSSYIITPSGFTNNISCVTLAANDLIGTSALVDMAANQNFATTIAAAQAAGFQVLTPTIPNRQGAQGTYPGCPDAPVNSLFQSWNALLRTNAAAAGFTIVPFDTDVRVQNSMDALMYSNPDTGGVYGRHENLQGQLVYGDVAQQVL